MRHRDEILNVLDQAQAELEQSAPGTYDLRSLLWDVLEDVQDSIELALKGIKIGPVMTEEVLLTVSDYLANHYGDD